MLARLPLALCASLVFAAASSVGAQQPSIVWQRSGGDAAAFSRDGALLAAGDSLTVHLYRAADGAELRSVRVRFGATRAMDFSPDGSLLAVGVDGFNQNLRVFRVATGELLFVGTHSNGTQAVAFSPDGSVLASGGDDRSIALRRASDFGLIRTIRVASGYGKRVTALAWSDDGSTLVAGDSQGDLLFFRSADGVLLRAVAAHAGRISGLRFSHDGDSLASSSFDGTLGLWTAAGDALRVIRLGDTGQATPVSVDFTADDARLVAGSSELVGTTSVGFVRFWRVSDGVLLLSYDRSPAPQVSPVAISPLGATFSFGELGMRIVAQVP